MSLEIKPRLRGHFHQAAFFFFLGACAMLLARASDTRTFVAALIYSISLTGLLGVSALYHRKQWDPEMRKWMRRLDHSSIFVLIAGTGTPLALLALPPEVGEKVLKLIWIAAAVGVVFSLGWVKAPKWVAAILYVAMGWIVFPYLPEFRAALGPSSVQLLLWGGAVYTLGAVVYALKRPNPWPAVFGYHEIFHLMVVIAAALHFVFNDRLIR